MKLDSYDDIVSYVQDHPVRGKVHKQWKENYYAVTGRPYYILNKYDEEGKIENEIEEIAKKRDNITFRNKLFPIHQTWVATFTEKLAPNFSMTPRTDDYDDRQKSRLSEYFAMYYWKERHLKKKLTAGVNLGFIAGNIFSKTYFDKSMTAEVQNKSREIIKAKIGDVDTEILNPFCLLADPFAKDLTDKNLRKIVEVIYVSEEVAKDKYGIDVTGNPIKPDFIDEFMLFPTDNWIDDSGKSFNGVVALEVWEKEKAGTWKTSTWIDRVKIKGFTKTGIKEHPYSQAKVIDWGTMYGESALKHGLQIQRDYNKMYGMFLDQMQHAMPILLTGYNAEITKGKLFGGGIEHIAVGGDASDIKFHPGIQINPAILTGLSSSKQEINEVLSTNEQSMGRLPSGSSHTPGYTHGALMRQDAAKLMSPLAELETMTADIILKALRLAEEHYTEERTIRVYGEEEGLRVIQMKYNTIGVADIKIDYGSNFPYSKVETSQFLIQLATAGILPPQTALENMDMGNVLKGVDDVLIDVKKAERNIDDIYLYTSRIEKAQITNPETGEPEEIYVIKDGNKQPVPVDLSSFVPEVREWDNHEVQLSILEREMKKLKFDFAPVATQEVFMALRQEYLKFLKSKQPQQPQQQQQQPQDQQAQAMIEEVVAQLMQGTPIESLANSYPPEILQAAQQIVQQQIQAIQEIQQKLMSGASPEQLVQEGYPQEIIQAAMSQMQQGGV